MFNNFSKMQKAYWFILILIACRSASQDSALIGMISSNGKIVDTVQSKILNEDRFIWIYLPKAAQKAGVKKFPVIFLLDAEANFDETRKALDKLSKEPSAKAAGDVILIGVGNIWLRYRDYSPTRVNASPWVDAATARVTGGGERFIAFLEKELLPFIEKKYPVSSDRTLIGHSMGGLQVINILLKHQQLFDNYIAIDPGMWWDGNKLLDESAALLHAKIFENKRLFLAVANETEMQMTMEQVRKDTSAKTALIRPSISLAEFIEKNKQNKLRFAWKFFKEEHHMTVNSPATYEGLKFLLH
jgi:predicted alpha/beta superfamily hydrolase